MEGFLCTLQLFIPSKFSCAQDWNVCQAQHIFPSSESLGITGHRMTSYDPSSLIPWAFLFKAGSPLLSPFYKPEALIHTVMLQHYRILATTLWEKYYHHQLYRWRYWDLEVDLPRVPVFSRYFSKVTCQWGHACTHKGHSQMDKTFDFRLSYSTTYLYLNHLLLSSLSYHFPKGSFEHRRVLVGIHTWRCSMCSCTNFWFDQLWPRYQERTHSWWLSTAGQARKDHWGPSSWEEGRVTSIRLEAPGRPYGGFLCRAMLPVIRALPFIAWLPTPWPAPPGQGPPLVIFIFPEPSTRPSQSRHSGHACWVLNTVC